MAGYEGVVEFVGSSGDWIGRVCSTDLEGGSGRRVGLGGRAGVEVMGRKKVGRAEGW